MLPKVSKKNKTPEEYKSELRAYYKAWYQANREKVIKKVMGKTAKCDVCDTYINPNRIQIHNKTKKHLKNKYMKYLESKSSNTNEPAV